MGGGSSESDNTVRFAPYLEDVHKMILNGGGGTAPITNLMATFNGAIGNSPYGGVSALAIDNAFFGSGYTVSSFPSLWDMFGKFMGGLDVHVLWNKIYEDTVQDAEISSTIAAHAALLDDEIQTSVLPRFNAGMRDINAVMSSSYVIGRALIEDARVKSVNKFASEIRIRAVDASVQIWSKHLSWNEAVIKSYSDLFTLYIRAKLDSDRDNMEYGTKDALWDLSLYENVRAMLGALGGGGATNNQSGPSQAAKSVGGALSGAAMGAQMSGGNPYGIAAGAIVGLAASFID